MIIAQIGTFYDYCENCPFRLSHFMESCQPFGGYSLLSHELINLSKN